MCISITRKWLKTEREEYRNDSMYEKKIGALEMMNGVLLVGTKLEVERCTLFLF